MNIVNATEQERSLIKEILHDYDTEGLIVKVVEKKRNYGHYSHYAQEIVLKRFSDIKDFYHILAHEVCHFIQHNTGEKTSERKADIFAVMMVNKKFGTNWTAEKEKKKYSKGYFKYLKVNKGENNEQC